MGGLAELKLHAQPFGLPFNTPVYQPHHHSFVFTTPFRLELPNRASLAYWILGAQRISFGYPEKIPTICLSDQYFVDSSVQLPPVSVTALHSLPDTLLQLQVAGITGGAPGSPPVTAFWGLMLMMASPQGPPGSQQLRVGLFRAASSHKALRFGHSSGISSSIWPARPG